MMVNQICFLSLLQVNNTDAEGRLTLADALIYACNQGVDKVMQIHTIVIINSVLRVPNTMNLFQLLNYFIQMPL